MREKLLALLLVLLLATLLLVLIADSKVGPAGVPASPSSSTPTISTGGGGGSRQIDLDRLLKAVQDGKKQKPKKFEELQKLLYIEPFSTEEYSTDFMLGLGISGNETLNRNDKFVVSATVVNPNPIEIRRALYLYLEALEPGDNSFTRINPVPQIIQINEYSIDEKGQNVSVRAFPDLTSFSDLKAVGPVILRLQVSDGQYNWPSNNLTLNVTNQPPRLENLTIVAQPSPRYNDAILYTANVTDLDDDPVNVTLHVIDDRGMERGNETQIISGEGQASFLGNEFFSESDSGKNFTYYYTFGDGIVSNNTSMQDGPRLRKSVSIHVENPWVNPEDENQYWWENYNFSLNMKNKDPEEAKVQVTLFTDTSAHPWKAVASKEVTLTQEPQIIYFNVRPFDVIDANQTFGYKFVYSEYDQHQKDNVEAVMSKPLNAKLIRYNLVSGLGLGNIAAILLIALALSILVERRFYR